jgi:hypothetical protein
VPKESEKIEKKGSPVRTPGDKLLLHPHGIGYRQFMTAAGATCSKHFFTALGTHPGAEAMLVYFLSAGGLECPFHR